jgi:periplasmic protein TonB
MRRAISKFDSEANQGTPFETLLTLVLWIFCLSVGVIGFVFPYMRPKAPVAEPPPTQAELIKVELTDAPIPPEIIPQPTLIPQPSAIKPLEIPQAPPMISVAEPSPTVAFALPVEAPARITDVKSASASKPAVETAVPSSVPVQTLTFGSGEGKQPAPEYPARARREGQEGVVLVRFTVGENGHVISAEPASPSPWPLLNESAVRTVRERWRFSAGRLRLYEVAIRFQMRE